MRLLKITKSRNFKTSFVQPLQSQTFLFIHSFSWNIVTGIMYCENRQSLRQLQDYCPFGIGIRVSELIFLFHFKRSRFLENLIQKYINSQTSVNLLLHQVLLFIAAVNSSSSGRRLIRMDQKRAWMEIEEFIKISDSRIGITLIFWMFKESVSV